MVAAICPPRVSSSEETARTRTPIVKSTPDFTVTLVLNMTPEAQAYELKRAMRSPNGHFWGEYRLAIAWPGNPLDGYTNQVRLRDDEPETFHNLVYETCVNGGDPRLIYRRADDHLAWYVKPGRNPGFTPEIVATAIPVPPRLSTRCNAFSVTSEIGQQGRPAIVDNRTGEARYFSYRTSIRWPGHPLDGFALRFLYKDANDIGRLHNRIVEVCLNGGHPTGVLSCASDIYRKMREHMDDANPELTQRPVEAAELAQAAD